MTDRLGRYREMRDFSVTPEPRGAAKRKKSAQLRYYIQRHDATRLHYDFRLELEGVLKSWAVPKGPSLDPADKRLAVQTEDHPLDYGEFEGTIPEKQYGAGDVLLWDKGVWVSEDQDPVAALRKGRLHFRLDGEKLHGRWILTRMRDAKNWLLIKRNDDQARSDLDIVEERPESVKRAPKKSSVPEGRLPSIRHAAARHPGHRAAQERRLGLRGEARRLPDAFAHRQRRSAALHPLGKGLDRQAAASRGAIGKLGLDNTWLDGEIVVPRPRRPLELPGAAERVRRRRRTRRSCTTCSTRRSSRAGPAAAAAAGKERNA